MKLRFSRKQKFLGLAVLAAIITGSIILSPEKQDEEPTARELEEMVLQVQEELHPGYGEVIELVQDVMAGEEDINQKDSDGNTPLMRAVMINSIDHVQLLLAKGAKINLRNKKMKKAIDLAENAEIRELLEACAITDRQPTVQEREQMKQDFRNCNIDPDNLEQLIEKASYNWRGNPLLSVAKAIALGADINAISSDGEHALQRQIFRPNHATLLLRNGADPNALLDKQGGSSILKYCINCNNNLPRLLLAKGASVKGANVIAAAAGNGNVEMVQKLLQQEADPNGMTDSGWSVLECAVRGDFRGYSYNPADFPALTRLLLEAGASAEVHQPDGTMRSPLSPGAMSVDAGCIRALVDAGADVNALNKRGANYAMVAAHKPLTKDNLELFKDIVSDTDELHLVDKGNENILFYMVEPLCKMNGLLSDEEEERKETAGLIEEFCEIIEDIDPDPTLLDKTGNTPLHLAAAKYGETPEVAISLLLKLGVDPGIRNKYGRTALDVLLAQKSYDARYGAAFKALAPVSPEPESAEDKVKIAILTGNMEKVAEMLKTPDSRRMVEQHSDLTEDADMIELFLDSGLRLPGNIYAFIAKTGDIDLLDALTGRNLHYKLSNFWDCVRSTEMAQAMLDAGVPPPAIDSIQTLDILKLMLEDNRISLTSVPFEPNAYRVPKMPLISVIDKPEFVKCLLERGVPVSGYASSPLVITKSPESAALLLKHGATLNCAEATELLTRCRNNMESAAQEYMEHRRYYSDFLEARAIYQFFKEQDFPEPHPRAEEIKKALAGNNCQEEFEQVTFVFPGWSDTVRISRKAMVMARTGGERDTAHITHLSDDYMEFKWDRWGVEATERRNDGKFHKCVPRGKNAAFLKNPRRALHAFTKLITPDNNAVDLLFSPDRSLVFRADTGEIGGVESYNFRQTAARFEWRAADGSLTSYFWTGEGFQALDASTAKKLLYNTRPGIDYREEKMVSKGWRGAMRLSQAYKVATRISGNRDTANIMEYSEQRIVLKWDRWGVEIFYKHPDGMFHSTSEALLPEHRDIREKLKNNDKSIRIRKLTLVHPNWQGAVNFSFKHKAAAQLSGNQGTAEVMHFSRTSITLRWDTGGMETYERGSDGKFHLAQ